MARLVVLASIVLAFTAASSAEGATPCEPFKATAAGQLQSGAGLVVIQAVLEGTLGGTRVIGNSLTTLTTPVQGVDAVDNPEPTEGGSQDEVFDEGKTEPPRSFGTVDRGMLIPTPFDGVLLLVVNATVVDGGSGELHYQGTINLESDAAVWQLSGSLCP